MHYFTADGAVVKLLNGACTTGKKTGPWLDAWLSFSKARDERLYQVEVKSWSFHGAGGGKAFPLQCDEVEFKQRTRAEWARYWDDKTGRFREDNLDKVFVQMKPHHDSTLVTPLACLWSAVNPHGLAVPFFHFPASRAPFDHVDVFSASIYLRNLLPSTKYIDIELPKAEARIKIFPRLFEVLKDSS
jgi:hypothetical protein